MNLYHYCSNAALISIISNKEIRASVLALSNDLLEGKWVREIFSDCCKDQGIAAAEQNDLLKHLDVLIAMAGYAGFCMSEEGDLLSQWRAYAHNGAGVSIGFNKDYFENLGNLKRDRGDEFSAHLTKIEYGLRSAQPTLLQFLAMHGPKKSNGNSYPRIRPLKSFENK